MRCTDDFERWWPSGRYFGTCSECGVAWPYMVTGFYASNVECFDAIAAHMAAVHYDGVYVGRTGGHVVPDATRREDGWPDARGGARPAGRPSADVADGRGVVPRRGSG